MAIARVLYAYPLSLQIMSFYTYRKLWHYCESSISKFKTLDILQCKHYKRAEIAFNYHGETSIGSKRWLRKVHFLHIAFHVLSRRLPRGDYCTRGEDIASGPGQAIKLLFSSSGYRCIVWDYITCQSLTLYSSYG